MLWASAGRLCSVAAAEPQQLIPIPCGWDMSRGNKRVLVTPPKGWEGRGDGSEVAFGLRGRTGYPIIGVLANHVCRQYSGKITPRHSYMGENLNTDMRGLKRLESVDAGVNGTLEIWRFHTYNRNYLLVLIVRPDTEGRTEVDVYLSSDDPGQLMRFLNSLKEVARSIRIVNR
jgi:hypothetical protein